MDQSLVVEYLSNYGYAIIFFFVFLQEMGIPTPIPNEIMLLTAGYLAHAGYLNIWLAVGSAVAADVIGTTILFTIFRSFGHWLLENKPNLMPFKREDLAKIERMLDKRGRWGIFLGRLMPYVRGYTSIMAGLMQMHYHAFITMVTVSAVLWSGGYVTLGYLLGEKTGRIIDRLGGLNVLMFIFIGAVLSFWGWRIWKRRRGKAAQEEKETTN